MDDIDSRRSHKRYLVKEGAFAVLYRNYIKLAQIIDISMAGFSFRCSDSRFMDSDRSGEAFLYNDHGNRLDGFSKFDIFLVDSGIYLDQIPCKIISSFEIDDIATDNSISMHRCGLQFDELIPAQISDLEYFIKNCTFDLE